MIVQCPSCSKRYRVNDDNIPPSGGKIRCPACSHAFVVYPDSDPDPDPEPDPASHEDPGAKTSVAQRPNMEELLDSMQGGDQSGGAQSSDQQGGAAGGGDDDVAKTEVMAGSELPDFNNLFGEGGPDDDQTVEMDNPLAGGGLGDDSEVGSAQGDDLKTQQLDSDIVDQSLGHVRDQAEQSASIEEPPDDVGPKTQVTPPPNIDEVPGPQHQQRASVPDDPTPPPTGSNSGPQSGNFSSGSGPASDSQDAPSGNFGAMPGRDSGGLSNSSTPERKSSPGAQSGGPSRPQSGSQNPRQGPGGAPPSQSGPQNAPGSPGEQRGDAGGGDGPDGSHEGPWKLKTNFGLTYEFADNDSLRNWLESRDELDGYELSADEGDSFYPLDEFPQVGGGAPTQDGSATGGNAQISSSGKQPPIPGRSTSSAGSTAGRDSQQGPGAQSSGPADAPGSGRRSTSSAGAGSGPLPRSTSDAGSGGHSPFHTAANSAVTKPEDGSQQSSAEGGQKERIDPNEKFEPPSRDGTLGYTLLWGVFILLSIVAIGLSLQLFGIVDFLGDDDDEEPAVVAQHDEELEGGEPAEDPAGQEPDELADDGESDEPDIQQLLEDARQHLESEEYEGALEQLEDANSIDPEEVRVYDVRADVYDELGDDQQADASRDIARHLRQEGELPEEALE